MKKIWILLLISCLVLLWYQSDHSSFPIADTVIERNGGEIGNIERFHTFLENFKQQEPDHIKIISYTTEGDPIYLDLQYDGKVINYRRDATKDKFGSGEVAETVCTELKNEVIEERIYYHLSGCEDQSEDSVLVIW